MNWVEEIKNVFQLSKTLYRFPFSAWSFQKKKITTKVTSKEEV